MPIRLKGRIPADDTLHQIATLAPKAGVGSPPTSVYVPGVGWIPQYAPTVYGAEPAHFDPAGDCKGFFTSYRYQPHNNCYNYAVDIATNTIAQPGRRNGRLIVGAIQPKQVVEFAELDGLRYVGGAELTAEELAASSLNLGSGHFVMLLIAPADATIGFDGDYHFVRRDYAAGESWSQKDGPDQITNFDFAGQLITNPLAANWTSNCGPIDPHKPGEPDFFITYQFEALLYVPHGSVRII